MLTESAAANSFISKRKPETAARRTYLPSCSTDDLGSWFTAAGSYLVEAEHGEATLEYRFGGAELMVSSIARP
jgi:hypothetical protein